MHISHGQNDVKLKYNRSVRLLSMSDRKVEKLDSIEAVLAKRVTTL